jgi:N utilization substance protein B
MSRPRTKARRLAAQAMYQRVLSKTDADEIINQFKTYETWNNLDKELFKSLVTNSCNKLEEIDTALSEVVDRAIDEIDPVELSLLRLGCYELMYQKEVPYKVVLNEYINLAKTFGSVKSHAYVNASLDKLAKSIRESEIK